jgi:hypothetical protein
MFIKVAISCKTKPAVYVIKASDSLLKHVSHEEFKQHLLPAMQKAMLRNPEIILGSVGHVIEGLSLDMSQYAQDVGRSLASKFPAWASLHTHCLKYGVQAAHTLGTRHVLQWICLSNPTDNMMK